MKRECPIYLPLVVYVLYVNRKSWMIHTSPMKHLCPVCLTCENYVDGNLPEDQELDSNVGNLPRLILALR